MPTDLQNQNWAGGFYTRLIWIVVLVAISGLFAAAEAALSVPADDEDGRAAPMTATRIGSSLAAVVERRLDMHVPNDTQLVILQRSRTP